MLKKFALLFLVCCGFWVCPYAQIPVVSIVSTVVKKVINALDLEVEKLQNQTIWLQDAQKTLENTMTQLQLDGITGWVQKQKDLYTTYYQELSQVKQVVADYDKVKEVISLQSRIVSEYRLAYSQFKQDKHFTSAELTYMYNVYSGILNESLKNLEQVFLVVNALITQMSDAGRVNIIDRAAKGMQQNYNDLKLLNNQNIQLSLERASDTNDLETVKKLYGLE